MNLYNFKNKGFFFSNKGLFFANKGLFFLQIRVFFFANTSLFFCEKSLVRVESFYKGALEVQGLSQLRISTKKQTVHCTAPKQWLRHSLTYTTSLPWPETHHLSQIRISTKKQQKAALHQNNESDVDTHRLAQTPKSNIAQMQPNATHGWSEHTHSSLQLCDSEHTHSGLQFCNIQPAKSAPRTTVYFFSLPLGHVLFATAACNVSISNLRKVLRGLQFFNILTSKCAFRHSGVQFVDIGTSKSAPKTTVFQDFHCQMCFSPQRRAIFRHQNFKKCSEADEFCAFSLQNLLFATAACNFWFLLWPHDSAPAAVTGLLFDWPDTEIIAKCYHRENTAFRDFSNIWRGCIFFHLTYALLHLLTSDLPALFICFSTLHIVGSLLFKLPSISISNMYLQLFDDFLNITTLNCLLFHDLIRFWLVKKGPTSEWPLK